MNNNKDQMHPQDSRNLIIFMLLSVALWFLYDTYVITPQTKAMKETQRARAELIEKEPELLTVKPLPRDEAIASTKRITLKNDELFGSISLQGGRIDDVSLSSYYVTLDKEKNVELLSPKNSEQSRYIDYGWVSSDKSLSLPNAQTQWDIAGNKELTPNAPIILFWDNGQGLRFERTISLDKEYLFTVKQAVYNKSGKDVVLYPYALVSQTGIPEDYVNSWLAHEGPMGFIAGELHEVDYSSMQKESTQTVESTRGWIGISEKYWLTALLPTQESVSKYRFKYNRDLINKERSKFQTDYTGSPVVIADGNSAENSYNLYVGAKKVLTLEAYTEKLGVENFDLAVDFGWFWFFTYPFFLALHYLGLVVGNMGVAIIILTAILRTAVFPLTNISYKSFAKMKVVTPQVAELRDKYGDDKQQLQAAIMELYQREGVNPMSGCLPILVQIPIFFAFYKILFSTIEIRHAPFFGWIEDLSARDPTSVFNLFGALPYEVPSFMTIGVWPCLMLAAMLFQKKLNPPPQDKLQRDMMNIFPFFITFIMASFASGLVIYWTFSAILSVIQQSIIMRSLGVPIYIFNKDKFEEIVEDQVEEGPGVHPLVDMAEDEAEKALFGDEPQSVVPDADEEVKQVTPPKPKKKKKKK